MNIIHKSWKPWLMVMTLFFSLNGYAHCGSEEEGSPFSLTNMQVKEPRVFIMDGIALASLKERIRKEPAAYRDALDLLKKEAASYLNVEPWTIIKKTLLPPAETNTITKARVRIGGPIQNQKTDCLTYAGMARKILKLKS